MTLDAPKDFLTGNFPARNENLEYAMSSDLLSAILKQLKIRDISQRCVISTQYSNATRRLTSPRDIVDIRFLSSGKPVFAQQLLIANNTVEQIQIGINEPTMLDATDAFGNGVHLTTSFGVLQLTDVWIESLQIRVMSNPGPFAIAVNNDAQSVPTGGLIQVYAWTHPNSDKDETR